MKLNLRVVPTRWGEYRVLSLRSGTDVRYSTNYYHECWHLVSDTRGSQMLGRLLWGLSYQRAPGTVVLLSGEQLAPTPFNGERSDPILLAVEGTAPIKAEALKELRRKIEGRRSDTTVRWRTHGLDESLKIDAAEESRNEDARVRRHNEEYYSERGGERSKAALRARERTRRIGGVICYTAPPAILRRRAREVYYLKTYPFTTDGMEWCYLNGNLWMKASEGEVQLFGAYDVRVWAAQMARRDVLASAERPASPEELEMAIAARRDELLERVEYGQRFRNPARKLHAEKDVAQSQREADSFMRASSGRSWLATRHRNAAKSLGIQQSRGRRKRLDDDEE